MVSAWSMTGLSSTQRLREDSFRQEDGSPPPATDGMPIYQPCNPSARAAALDPRWLRGTLGIENIMKTPTDPLVVGRHLARLISGEVQHDTVTRHLYSTAACIHRVVPLAVVFPRDTADVVRTAKYCAEERVPLTARGAGTSLAGQALGSGIILDFSRHMAAIRSVDPDARTVKVQPGLVAGVLSEELAPHGLFFPAEPSSGAFCTIGGVVGNNASGPRSLCYGATRDHVLELNVVLPDGSSARFHKKERGFDSWSTLETTTHRILQEASDPIRTHGTSFPKSSSGYLLRGVSGPTWIDLSKLIVGSEGTLALVTSVELCLSAVPHARAMLSLAFDTLEDAVDGVLAALESNPSAVEILGRDGIQIVRQTQPSLVRGLAQGVEALLLVEAEGERRGKAEETLRSLQRRVGPLTTSTRIALSDEDQNELWTFRRAALPILYRQPGPRRVAAFIEDNAVPPSRIAEYVRGLRRILDSHGLEMALFGHAGQGNFHVRPLVDLSSAADRKAMAEVAREVAELVIALGGSLSGEHGDGRSRSEFLPMLHGPLYPVMERIKRTFDPEGVLNPGIIVGAAEGTLTATLRTDEAGKFAGRTSLSFPPGEGSLRENVERCQGCGTCRTLEAASRMCPAYRATLREEFSPRGKANLLSGLHTGRVPLAHEIVELVASRCLQCGMCAVECPAGVDVPALVLELRTRLAALRGVGLRERFFDFLHFLTPIAGRFRRLVNPLLHNRPLRLLMDRTLGIAAGAQLPELNPPLGLTPTRGGNRVAYLADTYAGRIHPQTRRAVVSILSACGLEVVEPSRQPSGAVAMMCGHLGAAAREARKNLGSLHELAQESVPIIVSEPTAYHAIKHLYSLYGTDERLKTVAHHTEYLHNFLLRHQLPIPPAADRRPLRTVYHSPCHVVRQGWDPPVPVLLQRFPFVHVETLEEGCCGAAGTFGYKTETYELSRKIGQRLAGRLARDDFDVAVTDCSSCLMRMKESTTRVVHAAELLAWLLGIGPRPPGFPAQPGPYRFSLTEAEGL